MTVFIGKSLFHFSKLVIGISFTLRINYICIDLQADWKLIFANKNSAKLLMHSQEIVTGWVRATCIWSDLEV